jgi:SAM-dependent methyltransferase
MDELEQSVLQSLDWSYDAGIYPYLPYLLQDFWELGTPVDGIIELIKKHALHLHRQGKISVLDAGCGKGAVAVNLAREFGFSCQGIDGMPEFIAEAVRRAEKYGVQSLCRFEIGDIRKFEPHPGLYDLIILGSVGWVFGSPLATLHSLVKLLMTDGYIFIADSYLPDDSTFKHPQYFKRREIIHAIHQNRLEIREEHFDDRSVLTKENNRMYGHIKNRVRELASRYPKKKELFAGYLRAQQSEINVLEREVTGVTWVLQKS